MTYLLEFFHPLEVVSTLVLIVVSLTLIDRYKFHLSITLFEFISLFLLIVSFNTLGLIKNLIKIDSSTRLSTLKKKGHSRNSKILHCPL